jgi:hypothetical protein
MAAVPAPSADTPLLTRVHGRRLREIYRSAGWPCQDALEIDLLAAGMLERLRSPQGHETLRVTEAGLQWLATVLAHNRAALSAHEALVQRVAQEMGRAGRLAWTGLSLRARVAGESDDTQRWCIARPDVFSIRHTSVESYVEPVVHEIKVRRADLLADLRVAAKRAAYRDLGECWYVLGTDARGRAIAEPDEVPAECGVMLADAQGKLAVARAAQRPARAALPFGVWMALARATPIASGDEDAQQLLHDAG